MGEGGEWSWNSWKPQVELSWSWDAKTSSWSVSSFGEKERQEFLRSWEDSSYLPPLLLHWTKEEIDRLKLRFLAEKQRVLTEIKGSFVFREGMDIVEMLTSVKEKVVEFNTSVKGNFLPPKEYKIHLSPKDWGRLFMDLFYWIPFPCVNNTQGKSWNEVVTICSSLFPHEQPIGAGNVENEDSRVLSLITQERERFLFIENIIDSLSPRVRQHITFPYKKIHANYQILSRKYLEHLLLQPEGKDMDMNPAIMAYASYQEYDLLSTFLFNELMKWTNSRTECIWRVSKNPRFRNLKILTYNRSPRVQEAIIAIINTRWPKIDSMPIPQNWEPNIYRTWYTALVQYSFFPKEEHEITWEPTRRVFSTIKRRILGRKNIS